MFDLFRGPVTARLDLSLRKANIYMSVLTPRVEQQDLPSCLVQIPMATVSSLDDMHTETSIPCQPSEQEALEFATIVQFMRSDNDHVVFRRFQKLNIYNLLLLQHQILSLDEEVSRFDFDGQWNGRSLAKVLPSLRPLLKEYSRSFTESFNASGYLQCGSRRVTAHAGAIEQLFYAPTWCTIFQ